MNLDFLAGINNIPTWLWAVILAFIIYSMLRKKKK